MAYQRNCIQGQGRRFNMRAIRVATSIFQASVWLLAVQTRVDQEERQFGDVDCTDRVVGYVQMTIEDRG